MVLQGIAIIGGIVGLGSFLILLSTRIKSFKVVPFVPGILLLAWGAYLIFDFLSVVL